MIRALPILLVLMVAGAMLTTTACVPDALAAAQDDDQSATEVEAPKKQPYRAPSGAVMRNVILPGWGQHYNGQGGKGWVFTLTWAVGILLATETISTGGLQGAGDSNDLEKAMGIAMMGIAYGGSIFDAYGTAKRLNRENGYDLSQRAPPDVRVTLVAVRF